MQTTGLIPDHFSGSYGDRSAITVDTPQQVAPEALTLNLRLCYRDVERLSVGAA
jgi:hypothetical protein